MKLGLIGFGAFGRLAAAVLKEHFDLLVFDKEDRAGQARELGIKLVSLEEAASCKAVVFAVPISCFEESVLAAKPFVKEGSLVLDVCSVKEYPIGVMEKNLPENVEIVGTHPLFGPQSVAAGIKGLRVVVCPVRGGRAGKVKDFLEKLGLEVIEASAEEHDRQMAKGQALLHFIARGFVETALREKRFGTVFFERSLEIFEKLANESGQLFFDIQARNRFAKEEREKLLKSLGEINKKVS